MIQKLLTFFAAIAFSTSAMASSPKQQAQAPVDPIASDTKMLDKFGECMKSKKATMYGSPKCGQCLHLKKIICEKKIDANGSCERFNKNFGFVNCKDSAQAKACKEAKVGVFPHFTYENGKPSARPGSLLKMAKDSGCDVVLGLANVQDSSDDEEPAGH